MIAKLFNDLINEYGSSSILRERLEFLKDKVVQLEEKLSDLTEAFTDLQIENTKLLKQHEQKQAAAELTEHKGALFKRNQSGGYVDTVYCPGCRRPLGSLGGIANYNCKPCQIKLDFTGQDLPRILKELSEK